MGNTYVMCINLLWDFDLNVDVVVTITVATDPWNTFTREPDPLVGLDPRWDLQKHSLSEKLFLYAEEYLKLRSSSLKNESLLNMYSLSGHQRCRWVWFYIWQIWRNLAFYHLLSNGSSAVNGCRPNESPNSW